MALAPQEQGLTLRRIPGHAADYVRFDGKIDQSFDLASVGPLSRPTVFDLLGVELITFQGVRGWCEAIRRIPPTVPIYLVNVPACITDQLLQVPKFAGHAEAVTLLAPAHCDKCHKESRLVIDLLEHARVTGAWPGECAYCGHPVKTTDEVDIGSVAGLCGARSLLPEVATLLESIDVYRASGPERRPFQVSKLVEGSANLLRLSGSMDERVRARRFIDGLEGTLVVDLRALEVTPGGVRPWRELVQAAFSSCSPVVLVHLPHTLLEHSMRAKIDLSRAIIHSLIVPCYCDTCDDLRMLPLSLAHLLAPDAAGSCPRCGRIAKVVNGIVSTEGLELSSTPPAVEQLIKRFDELFSTAAVEAKMANTAQVVLPTRGTSSAEMVGPYRIIRPLAEGGMAQIFLAVREGGFSKPLAIKLFRRELFAQTRVSLSMFLREAKLCARLNHPNIIQVFDVGESDGNLYIVMEYLEGTSVAQLRDRVGRPFPLGIAIYIVLQVLRALEHAHSATDRDGSPLHIVHRDVSPSNILLSPDGHVKLIDFGIAITGQAAEMLAGNPGYMAPEHLTGMSLDGRADLFSAATVVHEMLSGKRLFSAPSMEEAALQIVIQPIPPVPNVPEALNRVLARAHQRDRAQRYQNAAEFAQALRAIADEMGGEASAHDLRAFMSVAMAGKLPPAPATTAGSPEPTKAPSPKPSVYAHTVPDAPQVLAAALANADAQAAAAARPAWRARGLTIAAVAGGVALAALLALFLLTR